MTPPSFSAVHVGGQRAYEVARKGGRPELEPREVMLYSVQTVRFQAEPIPRAVVDVVCSAGTYIRVLAEMVGARLGCPATLTGLVRTGVGHFTIQDAVTLEQIETRGVCGLVISPAQGLAHLQAVTLDDQVAEMLRNGRCTQEPTRRVPPGPVRLLDGKGALIGVGEGVESAGSIEICPRTILPR